MVTLGGELKSATELKFLAHARVPVTGRWQIPAIRPVNATWTGGATTVTLDDFHVVEECIEKAGRRAFPKPELICWNQQFIPGRESPAGRWLTSTAKP